MMNFFLWGLLFTLTTAIFNFTLKLSSAARTFEGLDVSLAQSAVVAIPAKGVSGLDPYFDSTLLESRIRSYFTEGLGNNFAERDWSLTYAYSDYRKITAEASSFPAQAEIRFACDIAGLSTYHGKRTFSIVQGAAYAG
jgi:hypothetical protein